MNFFTSTHAISLFPKTTFLDRKTLMARYFPTREETSQAWLTWYKGGSFTKYTCGDPLVPEVPTGTRYVGDSRCWMIPFDIEGLATSCLIGVHWLTTIIEL